MLEIMRNQAQSWLAKLILGGIALSFGLWGIGDYFTGSRVAYVAEVDGKPISDQSFSQTYGNRLARMQARLNRCLLRKLPQVRPIRVGRLRGITRSMRTVPV